MKLLIDNREPSSIIKYIEALNKDNNNIIIDIKSLDIGDYIFYDDKEDKIKVIIERKSIEDLESSIKDGRYREQSVRLNGCSTHNHNIIYLIEGNIETYKNTKFKSTIYSSIFSLNYFKGFSIICSNNKIETGEIIYNFICKLIREENRSGYYSLDLDNISDKSTTIDYLENIKVAKKSNITPENIFQLMLMQIPGISNSSAKVISQQYKTLTILLDSLKNQPETLNNLKLQSGRKINKNIIESLKKYLLI